MSFSRIYIGASSLDFFNCSDVAAVRICDLMNLSLRVSVSIRARNRFRPNTRMVGVIGAGRFLRLVASIRVSTPSAPRRFVYVLVGRVAGIKITMAVCVGSFDPAVFLVGNPRAAELDKMDDISTVMANSAVIYPYNRTVVRSGGISRSHKRVY